MIFAVIGEELGLVGTGVADPRVRPLRVGRAQDRARVPRSVRQAPRRGADGARLRPGRDQPRGRARARAADGNPAAVRLVRRLEPRGGARLRSASSLTSRPVALERQLRCLIAAGGTAGHVLPALAVADELRSRGVHVTFAGSPDRVEALLVPEAGYELDTFRIEGLPRRPSLALARSVLLAGRAPARLPRGSSSGGVPTSCSAGAATSRARWSTRRRGSGRLRRSPRPTRASGSRTGSRLGSRAASSSRTTLPDRVGEKYRVVGRPIPANARPMDRSVARAQLGLPAERAGAARSPARVPARARSTSSRSRRSGGSARRFCTSAASGTSARCSVACRARTTGSSPCSTGSAPRTARAISRSCARAGRSGSSPRPACPRSSSRIRSRPPITRR